MEAGGSEVQSQPGLHGLKSKHMIQLLKPEQECSKSSRKCDETASLGPLVLWSSTTIRDLYSFHHGTYGRDWMSQDIGSQGVGQRLTA